MARLPITNYKGEPLENRLMAAGENNDRIAMFFPGRGYTCAMPLLYYVSDLLASHGFDILHVEYRFDAADFPDPQGDQFRLAVAHDVEAAYAAVAAEGRYREIMLVGKSLGTVAIALLLKAHPELAGSACIWLTPLVLIENIRRAISMHPGRSLVMIGTADPHFEPEILSKIESDRVEIVRLEGADHSLEIENDIPISIEYLKRSIHAIDGFVRQRQAAGTE